MHFHIKKNFKKKKIQKSKSQKKITEFNEVAKPMYFDFNNTDSNVFQAKDIIIEMISKRSQDKNAFYLVDIGEVYNKYNQWISELPRIRPFFAMKCNPNTEIMKLLLSLGCGFDCASKNEIEKALSIGVSPDNIIYANPCKQQSYLCYVNDVNVKKMTFDNAEELIKIKEFFPGAELFIRILIDDNHSICKLGTKFGAPQSTWNSLLHLSKVLELNVIGVSFHVGSGCFNSSAFYDSISKCRVLFDLAAKMDINLNVIDVGGGFPGTDDAVISFSEIAQAITSAIDVFFPSSEFNNLDIIAEPGRFFVATSHTLAVNVIAKRSSSQENCFYNDINMAFYDNEAEDNDSGLSRVITQETPSTMYYLNDGVYGSFNCILFDHATVVPVAFCDTDGVEYPNSVKLSSCSIWGPTCDSMDCISKQAYLPELKVGDWILYKDMGAYTVAAGSNFNGMESPSTVYIDSRKTTFM